MVLLQAIAFARFADGLVLSWYLPPGRQAEIAALVEWVDANVPDEEAIAGDFMNSTAILAHAGNPIVLQPKYETDRSRRQAQLFFETFFAGTLDDFRALVRERFECDLVLIDRYTLQFLSPYTAGHVGPLREGTPAAVFLSQDEETLRGVPGFELLYRSPASIRQVNGEPYDLFRPLPRGVTYGARLDLADVRSVLDRLAARRSSADRTSARSSLAPYVTRTTPPSRGRSARLPSRGPGVRGRSRDSTP